MHKNVFDCEVDGRRGQVLVIFRSDFIVSPHMNPLLVAVDAEPLSPQLGSSCGSGNVILKL